MNPSAAKPAASSTSPSRTNPSAEIVDAMPKLAPLATKLPTAMGTSANPRLHRAVAERELQPQR